MSNIPPNSRRYSECSERFPLCRRIMKLIFSKTLFALTICACCFSTVMVTAQQDSSRYVIKPSSVSWKQRLQDQDQVSPSDRPLTQSRSQDPSESVLQDINPLRRPMASLSVDIREHANQAPSDHSTALTQARPDMWTSFAPSPIGFAWTAPNIRYQPLYFENVPLERYGQTRGPWREVGDSGFHFFASTMLLPYHAKHDRYHGCDYPLGFCRPGNAVGKVRQLHWWGL